VRASDKALGALKGACIKGVDMNEEVKALWTTALRSGEYDQGRRALQAGGKFCCLGVLCDLYRIHVSPAEEWEHDGWRSAEWFMGQDTVLPPRVMRWAGLETTWADYGNKGDCLTNDNDSGKTFAEIADVIEQHF